MCLISLKDTYCVRGEGCAHEREREGGRGKLREGRRDCDSNSHLEGTVSGVWEALNCGLILAKLLMPINKMHGTRQAYLM